MEQVIRRPPTVVLRRFNSEVVELLPAHAQIAAAPDSAGAACQIAACTDGDAQVYHVLLPESLIVRPVDWRRFAYDHAKVAELLSMCVRDNLLPLSFEPWSDDLRKCMEATMTLALGDLSSVFDVKSVRCESHGEGGLLITIEGEHKNGELKHYAFAFDPGSF